MAMHLFRYRADFLFIALTTPNENLIKVFVVPATLYETRRFRSKKVFDNHILERLQNQIEL